MKNLKLLSFVLLFWVLIIAWCEKANNQNLSCEAEDACPIEINTDAPSVEIKDVLSIVDEWNLEWDWEEEIVLENDNMIVEEVSDQPMMRKMLVDENATAEEIEEDMINTCANAGWTWGDWVCTLEDGSVIAF